MDLNNLKSLQDDVHGAHDEGVHEEGDVLLMDLCSLKS
jgi:hypothetical protein